MDTLVVLLPFAGASLPLSAQGGGSGASAARAAAGLIGLLLAACLGLFLVDGLRALRRTGRARRNREGIQEIAVLVERGYHPEIVVAEAGSPVRTNFVRAEDLPCSERVIFGGLQLERRLWAHGTTPVEFTPTEPGEYLFTCDLGMYQGWLRIEPARRRQAERAATGRGQVTRPGAGER